jgi:hypothetical protein
MLCCRLQHSIIGDKSRAWLRQIVAGLSPRRPGFAPGLVHVGFVVAKVALGQGFVRFLRPFPCIINRHSLYSYHLGVNKRPVGGRSSETSSHPRDMNYIIVTDEFHCWTQDLRNVLHTESVTCVEIVTCSLE